MHSIITLIMLLQARSLMRKVGRRGGLVVERRTLEREVGGSILTQVTMSYL